MEKKGVAIRARQEPQRGQRYHQQVPECLPCGHRRRGHGDRTRLASSCVNTSASIALTRCASSCARANPEFAPEEAVLNNYDIDFYMEKTDASPEKLYSVIRSCLRSSEDISTLLAFAASCRASPRALPARHFIGNLLVFMKEGIAFLELKHSGRESVLS